MNRPRLRGTTINSRPPLPVDLGGVRYNPSYVNKPWTLTQSAGGAIKRFEVRSGDRGIDQDVTNGNERGEVVTADFRSTQSQYRAYSNADYWLSFWFMVEPGAPMIGSYYICGQMHDIKDDADIGLSPPLCFVLGATDTDTIPYSLQSRSDPNPSTPTQRTPVVRWDGAITRGVWTRNVVRMRFDPFGSGQLQLWRDGVEAINVSGIPMGYNNPEDQAYWQHGIYRHENANTLAVRYANVEQAPTSLLDRVANPIPLPLAA